MRAGPCEERQTTARVKLQYGNPGLVNYGIAATEGRNCIQCKGFEASAVGVRLGRSNSEEEEEEEEEEGETGNTERELLGAHQRRHYTLI